MHAFLIFSLIWLPTSCLDATLRTRITYAGLQFFSDIGHHVVQYEVEKMSFPPISLPISGGPGSGEVNVSNMQIQYFESPQFKFKLAPPNGIAWKSQNGSIHVHGPWSAVYTVLIPIYVSGYVSASARDIRTTVEAGIYASKDRPQLQVGYCSMEVEDLEVEISGGVIPWIVNIFRYQLSKAVKHAIHDQLCNTIRNVLLVKTNDALLTFPTRIPVFENFFLNYKFQKNSIATDSYIEGEVYSNVVYGNKSCDLPTKSMDEGIQNTTAMAHIWVSEHIPNCLLKTAHENNILNFVIDKDFDKGKLKTFLSTNCSALKLCIGKFSEVLREKYPNEYVDFRFLTAVRPVINTSREGVSAVADFDVYLFISPWKQQTTNLARFAINATLRIMPKIENRTLRGRVMDSSISISQQESIIGNFSKEVLKVLENLMAPSITVILSSFLEKGVILPLVDNITVSQDASITLANGFIRMDSDFEYLQ